ncbi:MAG TPA: ABC transporter permease [Dokdonella sp.]|uniref:ABC transporter permease n=1 Tax=Dokdonella sp. TaxID=2291710 RepID=UPI002C34DDF9|nr:ABC transporter permease [Dokdonella sp.]HUD42494.1 ABC transporter permease [Dokdonella sp.]
MNTLRLAIRQLARTPGFTVVAVLTLALGIGACAAMFGLLNAVLLKPLPVQAPERLVFVEGGGTDSGLSARTMQVETLRAWQRDSRALEAVGGYFGFFDYQQYTLAGPDGPERVRAVPVTQNFLDVLGVRPQLGRNFVESEAGGDVPTALISDRFWRQRHGADPAIVGRTLDINGKPATIVGVLPASFDFGSVFAPGSDIDLLTPFPLTEETQRWGNTLFAVGRLAAGATAASAQTDLDTINARLRAEHPERGRIGAAVKSLETHVRGPFRAAFLILFGAVICLLLIACANLSNLLLTRAQARRKETAVRVALGARPLHLIGQTLTESVLLALAGGTLGVAVAAFATQALSGLRAFSIPLLDTARIDLPALGFAFAAACFAGVLCGAWPALALWRGDTQTALRAGGGSGDLGPAAARTRRGLVVAQVALACLLLTGASLLIRSFVAVMNVELGFRPQHAIAWRVDAVRSFETDAERAAYYEALVERVLAVPGVAAAGLSDTLPLGRNRSWGAGAEGVTYERGHYPSASPRLVDRRYLETLGVPLRAGRYFDARDGADAPKAVIVSETMARQLWPGRDPLGQRLMGAPDGQPHGTVIGVVGDVPRAIEEAPTPEMYFDLRQNADYGSVELLVRSAGATDTLVPAVRAALRAFDPTLASGDYTTLEAVVGHAAAPRRLTSSMLGGFSSLALLLAGLGVYGVIAYSVGQRSREIAVRLAVGSRPRGVVGLIVGEGLRIALLGAAIGLVAALAGARLLQSLLFGVSAFDPLVFVTNAAIVLGVAVLAALLPALRAAATHPGTALR